MHCNTLANKNPFARRPTPRRGDGFHRRANRRRVGQDAAGRAEDVAASDREKQLANELKMIKEVLAAEKEKAIADLEAQKGTLSPEAYGLAKQNIENIFGEAGTKADEKSFLSTTIWAFVIARAKWLTGQQLVVPDQCWINFSELGRARMEKVSNALINVAPDFFKAEDLSALTADSIRQPSPTEVLLALIAIAPVIAELEPPAFPPGERDTLLALFYSLAREKGSGQIPSSRF